jgi:hypothetical protein
LDLLHFLTGATKCDVIEQRLVFDGDIDREVELLLGCSPPSGGRAFEARLVLSWLRTVPDIFRLDFDACSLVTAGRPNSAVSIVSRGAAAPHALLVSEEGALATTVNAAVHLAWRSLLQAVATGDPCPLSVESCLPTIEVIEHVYRTAIRP